MPFFKSIKESQAGEDFSRVYRSILKRPLTIIASDPLALMGGIILFLLTLVAIFAPLIATHDPHEMLEKMEGIVFTYDQDQWEFLTRLSQAPLNDSTYVDGVTYVVGHGGKVAYYDGENWGFWELPATKDLYGISFFSSSYGMVVGESGESWLYENGQWHSLVTPGEEDLLAVDLVSFDYGVAVGKGGVILHWDGTSWEGISSPTKDHLYSVSLFSDDIGFIVGDQGIILRWSQGQLSREMVMGFRDLRGVSMFSKDLALAVGARGTIFRYDGHMWRSEYGSETRELRDIHFLSEDHVMVVGRFGVIQEYTRGVWARMENPHRRHWRSITETSEGILVFGSDPYLNELSPPTWENLFGTTHLGRDIFSQTVYGTRTALIIGFVTAFFVNMIGVNVGLFAGYFKGRIDNLLMRIVDIMYALPFEPFAMLLVMIFDPSITVVILSIGLLIWRTIARVIRSQVLSLAERPFVKAVRGAGASDFRILYLHIAPNILPLAFLQLAVAMGYAITAEATLSFLGLGPPRVYSWGTILHSARLSGAWRTAWWWIVPPGLLIMITVVCIFFIARALEILTNPRLEGELEDAKD